MLWKAEEWNSSSGKWYCGCISDLGNDSNGWLHPARILDITPAELIELLVKEYNAKIFYRDDYSFVGWNWDSQADMRKWKNYINKRAKEVNYLI